MRKKLWIVAPILVLVFLGAGILRHLFKADTVIYIDAGEPIIIFDRGEPVVMLGRKEGMFSGLRTGDRILILHDGTMMLSYPAQMSVHFCIRLKKGDVSDVPEAAMEQLREMGWLEEEAFGQNQ